MKSVIFSLLFFSNNRIFSLLFFLSGVGHSFLASCMAKRVMIVGAGPGGLVMAKECLDRRLLPVVFEAAPRLGGLWCNGVWPSMRTNVSEFSMSFSDWPWPMRTDDHFPLSGEVLGYLEEYATRFDLQKHIRLNTRVRSIESDPEHAQQWTARLQGTDSPRKEHER